MFIDSQTKVNGVMAGERQGIIASMRGGETITLSREPQNEYHSNAVAVYAELDGKPEQVGYLPRDLADRIAPFMDSGVKVSARLLTITGGYEKSNGDLASWGLQIHIKADES